MDPFESAEVAAAAARRPFERAFAKAGRAISLVAIVGFATAPTASHRTAAFGFPADRTQLALAATAISPTAIVPLPPATALTINHDRPFDGIPLGLAPFAFVGGKLDQSRAIDCLAAAAFYEAGDDPDGQRAVAQVVLNRVRHPAFPKTVCGVVFQGSERRTGCQFTFTCDGALARIPSRSAWDRASAIAAAAIAGAVDPRVGTATHYHADYVVPYWAPKLEKLAQIGAHIFYRWPGQWGRPKAFANPGSDQEPAIPALARLERPAGILGEAAPASDARKLALAPLPIAHPAGAPAEPAAIMVVGDATAAPGRWALTALDQCAGRRDCQVLVYGDSNQLERNRSAPGQARDKPLFLFIRDAASGMTVSLWDCSQVQRPSPTQCLPGPGAELTHLLRERPAGARAQRLTTPTEF
ncbi:MAG: hypothetical protein JWQ16_2502 [Novosphingobium sp.]|nr:hypothetical protein [Novosphingobium sp.]